MPLDKDVHPKTSLNWVYNQMGLEVGHRDRGHACGNYIARLGGPHSRALGAGVQRGH